ncbi:MAG: CDP-alcohol phosphatidyltransferase family protein [Methylomonas sp.]
MKHELRLIALLGCGALLLGFLLFGLAGNWAAAGQWLLQAGLLWGFVCWFAQRRLDLNRAMAEAPLYINLGWGNRLTILRGGLIALTGGFLFQKPDAAFNVLAPAVLYSIAAVLDRLDGFVARRNRQASLLGNELDISFDALGLLVAPVLAIGYDKLHWSYLLLSTAYYFYEWALHYRRNRGLPVYELPANPLRRTLAGFQMGFIAVALWPLLDPRLTTIAGIAFMLPVLFGFVVDWFVVTGRFRPQVLDGLASLAERFFQPGLRLLLILLLFLVEEDAGPFSPASLTGDVLAALISVGLILTGFASRFGALMLMMLLGWHYPDAAVDVIGLLLIFTVSWILLLGAGRFSLWQQDDEWVKRYDGA